MLSALVRQDRDTTAGRGMERSQAESEVVSVRDLPHSPGGLSNPGARLLSLAIVAVLMSMFGALAAPVPAAGSLLPTAPSESSGPPETLQLAPPIVEPEGRPPRLGTRRAADAVVEKRGVRLELWVPQEPVANGAWLPALLRVTNRRSRPIYHGGRVDDLRCFSPAGARFSSAALFEPGDEWAGNAALVREELMKLLTSRSLGVWTARPQRGCGDIGYVEPLPPGESFVSSVATWPRFVFGNQPLPSGTASIEAGYPFWLRRDARDEPPIVLSTSAPVVIEGEAVAYPSPQRLVDAMLRRPDFGAWVETRDLAGD